MNQQDITDFLIGLGNVRPLVASKENGDPEISWGDTFYYIMDLSGGSPKMPFATIVIKDYAGYDETSRLNRGGLFRLNVDLGKERFKDLFGYLPTGHEVQSDRFDYTALDKFFPHPVYAQYGWASIINPAEESIGQVREVLLEAHKRAFQKADVS